MPNDCALIAILGGTGKEGIGLAKRWAAAGHKIIIGSRVETRANQVADAINLQLGINTVIGQENTSAAKQADICVLAVNQIGHQEAIETLKGVLHNKILVDTTSRVDFRNPIPPKAPGAAEIAQRILDPTVRVVAAFQNVPAKLLSTSIGQKLDADVLVCSDDVQAAEQVIQLARGAGLRGYYAGRLVNAIVVEGLTAILINLNNYYKIKDASIMVTGISTGNERILI